MKFFLLLSLILLHLAQANVETVVTADSIADEVHEESLGSYIDPAAAQAECNRGLVYAQGCSGFICKLLNASWKSANSFRQGSSIGSNGQYRVNAGEVVGWHTSSGSGHVAVYIGGGLFMDVPGPNNRCRTLRSYGGQEVFRMDY